MCTCQECGSKYKVDLLIPDELWERIKPEGKSEGAGLLCGSCIMKKLEEILDYSAFYLE
jgi:glycyl-tRNA synthetase (class II)